MKHPMPALSLLDAASSREPGARFRRRVLRLTVLVAFAVLGGLVLPRPLVGCDDPSPAAADDAVAKETETRAADSALVPAAENHGKESTATAASAHTVATSAPAEPVRSEAAPAAPRSAPEAGDETRFPEAGTLPFIPLFFLPLARAVWFH